MNVFLFLSALLNVADAKKNKGGESSTEASAESQNDKLGDVPSDPDSKKFAKKLISTSISNFSPDAEGLRYNTMTFNGNNTWTTEAVVHVMDEEMECTESGSWTMDPASSPTVANMNWTIDSSNCPTRQTPINLRVEVTLVSGPSGINVNFR